MVLQINQEHEKGPFDIIGDVHGCFDELMHLLSKLGYSITKNDKYNISHPRDRKMIFVGDLIDRGANSAAVLRLVMDAVETGIAFCVMGNHDDKLKRKLLGHNVIVNNDLHATLVQLQNEPLEHKVKILDFLLQLPCHSIFDEGNLVVVHAAIKEQDIGLQTSSIYKYCIYGPTADRLDEFGLPIRLPWAQDYEGAALIVYGHTPIIEPVWENNTVNIDTGCVFGGKLTAFRYPEKTFMYVDAVKSYSEPKYTF